MMDLATLASSPAGFVKPRLLRERQHLHPVNEGAPPLMLEPARHSTPCLPRG